MSEEEKKNKDPIETVPEVMKNVFAGITVASDEDIAKREEEIRKYEEEQRKANRERNFLNSGIAEKFENVELSDILEAGIAEMKDKE